MYLDTILIYILALIQPGPSFIIICSITTLHGRAYGLITSLATIIGMMLQSGIIIFFFNVLQKHQFVINILKIFGAMSLITIGLKTTHDNTGYIKLKKKESKQRYFIDPLLVELCNPIALNFFISILPRVVKDNKILNLDFWIIICLLAMVWFFFIALIASNKLIFSKVQKLFSKIAPFIGVILISYGCWSLLIVCT